MNRKLIFTALLVLAVMFFTFTAIKATVDEAELKALFEKELEAFNRKGQETYITALVQCKKDAGWKPDWPLGEYSINILLPEWYELHIMAGIDKTRLAHINDYEGKRTALQEFEKEIQEFLASNLKSKREQ